jgi:hypothetical protein
MVKFGFLDEDTHQSLWDSLVYDESCHDQNVDYNVGVWGAKSDKPLFRWSIEAARREQGNHYDVDHLEMKIHT